jgi:general secretion pathway protein C
MSTPLSLRDFQSLTTQQWLDRASRTLPQALAVILVLAIAWQLVQLTWLLLDSRASNTPAAIAAAPQAVTGPRKGPDIDVIVNAHLFGTQQAEQNQVADAPQTQMNLLLTAVFATNDPAKGLAIIGDSATTANVYSVGEAVRPGTVLHSVFVDKVILERGGQLETLALPTQNLAGLNMSQAAAPPRPANQFNENLRRLAETNPTAFSEVVRPQPVFANGVQRGYRVYPGRNRQQFARLGLQPGDLVLAINGTPLDDPQRGMEIFGTMGNSDRVTVSVERNGQTQDLTLNTAQITLPEAGPGAAQNPPTPSRGALPRPPQNPDGNVTE